MRGLLMTAALLALATGAKKETKSADPNDVVAKSHGGKVWVEQTPVSEANGADLAHWLSSHPSTHELTRKGKDAPWSLQFLAIFRKPAPKGAVIVQFVDKKD